MCFSFYLREMWLILFHVESFDLRLGNFSLNFIMLGRLIRLLGFWGRVKVHEVIKECLLTLSLPALGAIPVKLLLSSLRE